MTALPAEKRAAKLVRDLAHQLLALDERIKDNDREIRETFRADDRAEIIESLPGMGPILGAEFVAIVGDLAGYKDAGRLAAHAGLAPVARDSAVAPATTTGPSATTGGCGTSSTWPPDRHDATRPLPGLLKKRAEGLLHTQALLALARRRVDVLWAMLRDKRLFTPAPPITQTA